MPNNAKSSMMLAKTESQNTNRGESGSNAHLKPPSDPRYIHNDCRCIVEGILCVK